MNISDMFTPRPTTAVPAQTEDLGSVLERLLVAQMPRMTGHYLYPGTWGDMPHGSYDQFMWGMEPVGTLPVNPEGNVVRLPPVDARRLMGSPANR